MEIKCVEPIIESLSNEKPIGRVSFCFGNDIIKYNTFNENKIEKKITLNFYGYCVYWKNTLFLEFPLSGFDIEDYDILNIAESFGRNFEKEFNIVKESGFLNKDAIIILSNSSSSEDYPYILNNVCNMKIIIRNKEDKKQKFLVVQTDANSVSRTSANFGFLMHGEIFPETIENMFTGNFKYDKLYENEKLWEEVKADNKKVSDYVELKYMAGDIAESERYRYPAIINDGNVPPHTHWPYPQDKDLNGDHFTNEVYKMYNPSAGNYKRPLSIKARFLNIYAGFELKNSLKKGTFDERVGYPKHLMQKYKKEISTYYKNLKMAEEQKHKAEREDILTEAEKKVFNEDILTFRTGATKDGDNNKAKLPLIPTVINSEIEKLENKFKYINLCKSHGIYENRTENLHMCFLGNPGTGKTTVAREITQMFYDLGYIKHNECVEVNAQNIKGGYVGQTATITKAIIKHARGRVLFIDEAYALYDDYENGYGKEAVAVLLKEMEDNRDNFIVIFAGYTKEMQNFLDMNEGLRSRINRYIEFPDFNKKELCSIFIRQLGNRGLNCDEKALRKFFDRANSLKMQNNFSNARCVRNIVEKVIEEHAYNYMSNPVGKKYTIMEKDLTDEIFDEIINMSH